MTRPFGDPNGSHFCLDSRLHGNGVYIVWISIRFYPPICLTLAIFRRETIAKPDQSAESIRPSVHAHIPLRTRFACSRPLSLRKGTVVPYRPSFGRWFCIGLIRGEGTMRSSQEWRV